MIGLDSIVVAGSMLGALSSAAAALAAWMTKRRSTRALAETQLSRMEELTAELDRSGLPPDHLNELRNTISRLQRDLQQMPLGHGAGSGIGSPPSARS
jgi:hypothetical protein